MVARNIILTGIPRSGSTLTCHLINLLPDCLALVEPLDMAQLVALKSAKKRTAFISSYFEQVREEVHSNNRVPIPILQGQTTNTFSEQRTGGRTSVFTHTEWQPLNKSLTRHFTLLIKHPNAFSALLGELTTTFSCFALIRNPLAILASWDSLDHPLRDGHAPMAERFDPELKNKLYLCKSSIQRQMTLLDWYFRKYSTVLDKQHILRYEDLIDAPRAVLSCVSSNTRAIREELTNRNESNLYNARFVLDAAQMLLTDEANGCWQFYEKQEVFDLSQRYAYEE